MHVFFKYIQNQVITTCIDLVSKRKGLLKLIKRVVKTDITIMLYSPIYKL